MKILFLYLLLQISLVSSTVKPEYADETNVVSLKFQDVAALISKYYDINGDDLDLSNMYNELMKGDLNFVISRRTESEDRVSKKFVDQIERYKKLKGIPKASYLNDYIVKSSDLTLMFHWDNYAGWGIGNFDTTLDEAFRISRDKEVYSKFYYKHNPDFLKNYPLYAASAFPEPKSKELPVLAKLYDDVWIHTYIHCDYSSGDLKTYVKAKIYFSKYACSLEIVELVSGTVKADREPLYRLAIAIAQLIADESQEMGIYPSLNDVGGVKERRKKYYKLDGLPAFVTDYAVTIQPQVFEFAKEENDEITNETDSTYFKWIITGAVLLLLGAVLVLKKKK